MKKTTLLVTIAIMLLAFQPAAAKTATVLFVPADDRPVSFEYVIDTAQAAGVEMLTPPIKLLGNRTSRGNPDALWDWVFSHYQQADAVVVSGDSMLYGSLVGSRVHDYSAADLQQRMANFAKLKATNPLTPLYVFATIMRTPKMSAGGVEPDYYEQYGPEIFQISALKDKRDLTPLTSKETVQLQKLSADVPQAVMADWMNRRAKNYNMDVRLINYAKDGTLDYLILGRDDCSPLSQSHKESRALIQEAQGLTESRYASFPGADQLGMLLVTRAINELNCQIPFVKVIYAEGVGPKTVPTYEDKEVGQTITSQVAAAGGLILDNSVKPDMILAVNTPENGKTLEANSLINQGQGRPESDAFARRIEAELASGSSVAVANIAFANGADNNFMYKLNRQHLLPRLAALSAWNTASNTIGYTIGQGLLAPRMTPQTKNRLVATRLLDDWAYQANVRSKIADTVLGPAGGSYFHLNNLAPLVTASAQQEIQAFAAANLQDFAMGDLEVSLPWDRMFEVKIHLGRTLK